LIQLPKLEKSSRALSWVILLALASLAATGCKSKKGMEGSLPLPPATESGVYDGQFIEAESGLALPLPAKWVWIRLSAEQEVDEVARFSDPHRDLLLRLTVQNRTGKDKLSERIWAERSAQDLQDHLFKIVKKGKTDDWKTSGPERWYSAAYQVTDSRNHGWGVQEWALERGELVIGAHAMLPSDVAESEQGKKLFKAMEGALTQVHWYMPIGPRGISIERFELGQFTESFRAALESRSLVRVNAYLDELFPDRSKWNAWYQQIVAGDPKSFELKAETNGLVINGDNAAASFSLTRRDRKDSTTKKIDRNFKLSKKEGTWKITASLDKY
jgi:hypothetical protein